MMKGISSLTMDIVWVVHIMVILILAILGFKVSGYSYLFIPMVLISWFVFSMYLKTPDNPYDVWEANGSPSIPERGVCAVDDTGQLHTFKTEGDIPLDMHLTHYNRCGTCSSLQDLEVYINNKEGIEACEGNLTTF